MIDEHYFGGVIAFHYLPRVNDPEFKKYNPHFWHEANEAVEFSKGNRDYLAGFKPDWADYGEVPVILSLKYNIKHKNGSLIITDWDYDLTGDEKWKKFTWICNKETGLTFHRGSNK
jgi:hypothetical protein